MAETEETRRASSGLSGVEIEHDNSPVRPPTATVQRTEAKKSRGKRKQQSAESYRCLFFEVDQQRIERRWSVAELCDKAGLNDGHLGHILAPDSPHGRVARWEIVDLVLRALHPRGYVIKIIGLADKVSALTNEASKPDKEFAAKQVRHWRLSKFFRELGARGGAETARRHGSDFVKERGRRGARVRWQRDRERRKNPQETKS